MPVMTPSAARERPAEPPAQPVAEPVALLTGPAPARADWEKLAASVLRKSRRLSDDDPDDRVESALARTTLDGIAVTPLGTPETAAHLQTSGRPERVGEWDVRGWFADPDPKATAADNATDLD